MERFVEGDIVVLPFPFSDLTGMKRRPALVIVTLKGNDVILCPLTTIKRDFSIELTQKDGVRKPCRVRYQNLFTFGRNIISYTMGKINSNKFNQIRKRIRDLF